MTSGEGITDRQAADSCAASSDAKGARWISRVMLGTLLVLGLAFVLWQYWPQNRQQRVERLLWEYHAAPKEWDKLVVNFTYWGRDDSVIFREFTSLGPEYVPALCDALNGVGKKPELGHMILGQLKRLDDPQAVDALHQYVWNGGGEAGTQALDLYLKFADRVRDPRVTDLLLECLSGRVLHCQRPAALNLAWRKERRAVEPLIQYLKASPDGLVWAIEALGEMGDRRAVESIRMRLRSEDEAVREAAAKALKALGEG